MSVFKQGKFAFENDFVIFNDGEIISFVQMAECGSFDIIRSITALGDDDFFGRDIPCGFRTGNDIFKTDIFYMIFSPLRVAGETVKILTGKDPLETFKLQDGDTLNLFSMVGGG